MRLWPAIILLAGCAPFALLLVQCGGSETPPDEDLALPDRGEPIDSTTIDAADAGSTVDAADSGPPPACDLAKPFDAPVLLAEFDAAASRGTPRLSADELTIYFTTRPGGNSDLSSASRSLTTMPFAGEQVMAVSTPSNDNDPSVSFDNLTLFFHSNRGGNPDIWLATRLTTATAFAAPVPVTAVNVGANDNHPYFRAAGSELWLASDRAGSAGHDIFRSVLGDGGFAPPARVTELSGPTDDFYPTPAEDGLTIVFASDRAGGKGKLDLWMARRSAATDAFGTPVPLTELNSPNIEQAGWLSADGCRIWFSSGRANNDDHQQIYSAVRPK